MNRLHPESRPQQAKRQKLEMPTQNSVRLPLLRRNAVSVRCIACPAVCLLSSVLFYLFHSFCLCMPYPNNSPPLAHGCIVGRAAGQPPPVLPGMEARRTCMKGKALISVSRVPLIYAVGWQRPRYAASVWRPPLLLEMAWP